MTALKAVKLASDLFPSMSMDLIFGWHGQTEEQLQWDMERTLASGAQHISTYQLTIEENTAFARAEGRGQTRSVPPDQSAELYDQLCQTLNTAGFDHYEVSNFARTGHRSRHNLAYWRGQDYVGAGPGAHGRVTIEGMRRATVSAFRPADYQRRVTETGHSLIEFETLSPQAVADEYVIMGLRVSEGISMSQWKSRLGQELPRSKIQELIASGHLKRDGDRLSATENGRRLLNSVTEILLT